MVVYTDSAGDPLQESSRDRHSHGQLSTIKGQSSSHTRMRNDIRYNIAY